jgi:(1->4)-alpha-D-glucan 1-alpha-D-glucosylmutase
VATPTATYRLQIRGAWPLFDAAARTGYLAGLGVDAVYCSPLLQAAAGSQHGYDVVDNSRIDSARGGRAGWETLVAAARSRHLGLVVDIVPNHLSVADANENLAWWDVLRHGRDSRYANWFDVEWSRGRLLLPVLGDGVDLRRDLSVVGDELHYADRRFPIAPATADDGASAADIHDRQHYELVNFRRADTDQSYRRFFAVSSLAGLRVEDPEVFAETHAEILRWVAEDGLDGLRIDHPDGLADPTGYLHRLAQAAPGAWIVVEKILEPGEQLPSEWPVAGTTGYDALAEVTGLFVDPSAKAPIDALYRELTGDQRTFGEHIEAGKRFVADTILQAELARLARLAPQVEDAAAGLEELVVAFPVYRSYMPIGAEHLAMAIEVARSRRPDLADVIGTLAARLADPADEMCVRFQQTSGAVMAKGVEDTAFYRYTRFLALNDVGSDPGQFGLPVTEFHAAQARRQDAWPLGMTTLSTHDTKRSEDVRARMLVLAELPAQWATLARRLMSAAPVPNPAFGYLIWQTFVGAGLIAPERMHAYAEKAMREAADGTGWIDPDLRFEAAVHAAVDAAYDQPELRGALQEFIALVEPYGWSNSLAQKLVQLTMPGVPDVYQGTELWDDSLVDPDNRRPVDFDQREAMLGDLDAWLAPPAVDDSGAAKLWLVSRVLRLRREHPELFRSYTPLYPDGPAADHAVVYDRGGAIAIAVRLPVTLARDGGWRDTTLTLDARYRDVLTGRAFGGAVPLAALLDRYPVALLV